MSSIRDLLLLSGLIGALMGLCNEYMYTRFQCHIGWCQLSCVMQVLCVLL